VALSALTQWALPAARKNPNVCRVALPAGQFSFEDVVLKGLATDGGLYIPETIPRIADDKWTQWRDLSFEDLAFEVLSLYVSPAEIPAGDLRGIISRSYAAFRAPERTPLVKLKDDLWLLELFHGPTFAFKDVALQFLGNLFEYFLGRRNEGKVGKGTFYALLWTCEDVEVA
jgi:threonine synthase